MRRKFLFLFFVIFIVINLFIMLQHLSDNFSVTGGSITSGTLALFIGSEEESVYIHAPENITYNFSIGEDYILDLNVSSNFDVDVWEYNLSDLKHNAIVYQDIGFTPNTTFEAVRWQNKLTVSGEDSFGGFANRSVVFYVFVPNSAPIIEDLNSSLYLCEGESLSYYFNVTDVDEDILYSDILPKNPFYVYPIYSIAANKTRFEIVSGILGKFAVGGVDNGYKIHEELIAVSDEEYSDYGYINITIIEINNNPYVKGVGVQTVQTKGEDSVFYKQVSVEDIEDGNESLGNFDFNLSFLNSEYLFGIDDFGIMNFTPGSNYDIGVYDITLCVNDTGIENPFEGIVGNCSQDGGSISDCHNFSLTITDENRAPTIIEYSPVNLSLSVSGTDVLKFNITKYDPDGTIPDAYWFVGGVEVEYDTGNSTDEFFYSFGCGVSGSRNISVRITDGLLFDFVEWELDVSFVECPVSLPSSGGGGGGGVSAMWVCEDWDVCQNTEKSLDIGLLSGDDYREIRGECSVNDLDVKSCGFQTRECVDLKNVSYLTYSPPVIQFCNFVFYPDCYDFIKNCHHGSCEFLIDCGGPCPPCPTCSDGIKNQGEKQIDCGGPCPLCFVEEGDDEDNLLIVLLLVILVCILLIAIWVVVKKIIKIRKKIK